MSYPPPEVPEDKTVVVAETAKIVTGALINLAFSWRIVVLQVVNEILSELPGLDFIEIRAVRYDIVDKEASSGEQDS